LALGLSFSRPSARFQAKAAANRQLGKWARPCAVGADCRSSSWLLQKGVSSGGFN